MSDEKTVYKTIGPDGIVEYSNKPGPGSSSVVARPPPPASPTGAPNHTPGLVYTKVLVNGREQRMEYGKAREYEQGLQEQLAQAKERAKREIVDARNAARNFQNANQARDKFYAAGEKLANAQRELWEAAQEANATLGFQDRLQDTFSAIFSGVGVALLIAGTLGAPALVVGAAGVVNTALDWTNSELRQHNATENKALDRWAKANDVAGLIPGARTGFGIANTAAGMVSDGVEIADSKPVGLGTDVYTPEGRQAIRNSVDWHKNAEGEFKKGEYQDRWGIDEEKIKAADDRATAAQEEFDAARAAYEIAERRRFDRTSYSEPKK